MNSKLTKWQELKSELAIRVVKQKSISDATETLLLKPMQKMEYTGEEMQEYSGKLLNILRTSKTEQEILERAEKLQKE